RIYWRYGRAASSGISRMRLAARGPLLFLHLLTFHLIKVLRIDVEEMTRGIVERNHAVVIPPPPSPGRFPGEFGLPLTWAVLLQQTIDFARRHLGLIAFAE